MLQKVEPGFRYTVRVRFGHPDWRGKLVNLARFKTNDRPDACLKILEYADRCHVSPEAFLLEDNSLRLQFVYITETGFVALDRLPSTRSKEVKP